MLGIVVLLLVVLLWALVARRLARFSITMAIAVTIVGVVLTAGKHPVIIIDLDTKKVLFQVEHEVRSMRHPLFGRPLINRNPDQTNTDYHPGHDGMAHTTGWA